MHRVVSPGSRGHWDSNPSLPACAHSGLWVMLWNRELSPFWGGSGWRPVTPRDEGGTRCFPAAPELWGWTLGARPPRARPVRPPRPPVPRGPGCGHLGRSCTWARAHSPPAQVPGPRAMWGGKDGAGGVVAGVACRPRASGQGCAHRERRLVLDRAGPCVRPLPREASAQGRTSSSGFGRGGVPPGLMERSWTSGLPVRPWEGLRGADRGGAEGPVLPQVGSAPQGPRPASAEQF